jgi:DNA-binding response OmpR family regulator
VSQGQPAATLSLLLVEDNPGDARLAQEALRSRGAGGWTVRHCTSIGAVRDVFQRGIFDAALVDLGLPDASGVEAVAALLEMDRRLPIIVLTGSDDEELAAAALRAGAQDYALKSLLSALPLDHLIRHSIERQNLRRRAHRLLLRSEAQQAQLAALLATLPEGILVLSEDRERVLYANPSVCCMLGTESGKLLGQPFHYPLPPEPCRQLDLPDSGDGVRHTTLSVSPLLWEGQPALVVCLNDITEQRRAAREREELIEQLQRALSRVKLLSGLLPICMHCKKIRGDGGQWVQLESYIHQHSEAEFSHGLCSECGRRFYPDVFDDGAGA